MAPTNSSAYEALHAIDSANQRKTSFSFSGVGMDSVLEQMNEVNELLKTSNTYRAEFICSGEDFRKLHEGCKVWVGYLDKRFSSISLNLILPKLAIPRGWAYRHTYSVVIVKNYDDVKYYVNDLLVNFRERRADEPYGEIHLTGLNFHFD